MQVTLWLLVAVVLGGVLYLPFRRLSYNSNLSRIRRRLSAAPNGKTLTPEALSGLPEPAQRYLRRAVPVDRPLPATATLEMSGAIQPDSATPPSLCRVEYFLAPQRGFIWICRFATGKFRRGTVFYGGDGASDVRFFTAFGLRESYKEDPYITRSLVGRLAGESIWAPFGLVPGPGVTWEAMDAERAKVTVTAEGETTSVVLRIDPEGRLKEAVFPRWKSEAHKKKFDYVTFGIVVDEDKSFDGFTIPSKFTAGWWYGTPEYEEAQRFTVDRATFN